MKQMLTPLTPDELERLRTEWATLPVHDPRPKPLLMLDQTRAELDAMRCAALAGGHTNGRAN
jgi:recombinational DNA repair ATPase RecF